MNKDKRINDFFNIIKKIKFENPNMVFDDKLIYKLLTGFYTCKDKKKLLTGEERSNKEVKNLGAFPRWVDRFMYCKNTKAYVSPGWEYFCQFECGNLKYDNDGEFIKIYIPLDIKHIEIGANKIFGFLDNMGIKHASKISSDIRFDDIVVRVGNKEDADALINFIKNDRYIQKGLYKPNPFAFNKDGLALACDGHASYNSVLSNLITLFINYNSPNNLNSNNFYSYVYSIYKGIYNGEIDAYRFISVNFISNKPDENDFTRILELIIKSHNPNFRYKDFIDHFENGLNTKKENAIVSEQQNIENSNLEQEVYNALSIMGEKYNLNEAILRLKIFIKTNDPLIITKTSGLRYRLLDGQFSYRIINYMKENNIYDFDNYCNNIFLNYDNFNHGNSKI